MQVLEILNAHEHRIVGHPAHAEVPQGMTEWPGPYDPRLPFERVWAEAGLHAATVHEIINGYCPAPGDWPTHAEAVDD